MTMYSLRPMRRSAGFTLIELVVTLAIIGILASIALPSYRAYVMKGKRRAAQAQMMDIANREEQFLLANRAYADKTTLTASGYAIPSELTTSYTYDVTPDTGTVPGYTISFTAIGGQTSDGNLSLTSGGVKSPSDKW